MTFKPLYDHVLIERELKEEKTAGGILLPESVKEKPLQGLVIAVGNGYRDEDEYIPLIVKTGDKVLFSKYSGKDIVIDGKEYVIVKESEILGILA